MIKLRNKLFLMTAVTTLCAAIQPAILSAQTSGVGGDGYTRFLWRGTDGSISLWRVDGNLLNPISHTYGPYAGWTPVAITTGFDNYTRVLWRGTDGSADLWLVDPNLNLVTSVDYGAYYGWLPESISIDAADRTRLLWRHTNGSVSIWMVNPTLAGITSQVYGPFFGWDPGTSAAKSGANALKDNTAPSDETPDSMKRTPSIPIPPPQQ